MANNPRFHAPPAAWDLDAGSITLDPAESRHCASVLRGAPGDAVRVFDGEGRECEAVITATGKQAVTLAIQSVSAPAPPLPELMLALAIPKGKTIEWIIEKSVELGVAAVRPLITARTIVRLDGREGEARRQKWQRVAIEACKQCGQNRAPQIAPPVSLESFLSSIVPAGFDLPLIGSLDSDAITLGAAVAQFHEGSGRRPANAGLLIGPEGDFTPAEYAMASAAGWIAVTFGSLVLRVETAALFALSVLRHELSAHSQLPASHQP